MFKIKNYNFSVYCQWNLVDLRHFVTPLIIVKKQVDVLDVGITAFWCIYNFYLSQYIFNCTSWYLSRVKSHQVSTGIYKDGCIAILRIKVKNEVEPLMIGKLTNWKLSNNFQNYHRVTEIKILYAQKSLSKI